MKKRLLLPLGLLILIASCKPKDNDPSGSPDTTPPVITLNGRTNDTISLNSSYSDPGATANDNVDGNVSGSVISSGNINSNLVGEYRRYYNVKDAAGNAAAQMTRYVYVKNDADYLVGIYNANTNCSSTQTSSFVTTNVQISTTVNNEITVSNLGHLLPNANITVKVSGQVMNITNGSSANNSYSGNGTIHTSKKEFTLNYLVSQPYSAWSCSTTYKKQ